jgi:hypothetical protein
MRYPPLRTIAERAVASAGSLPARSGMIVNTGIAASPQHLLEHVFE